MKWVLFISLLLSVSLGFAADGHSTNNGGGVICINGECKTLIEAGLEIKPEYHGIWLPDGDLIKAIQEKISWMAFLPGVKQDLAVRVLGRLDQFRKADILDPVKLEGIRNQYIDLAEKSGFYIDSKTFEIVAFSSDDTVKPALTYLLPKFFNLTKYQQADILVHEGLYRGQPSSSLKYVMQFENAVKNGNREFISNKINSQIAALHLKVIDRSQLLGHMFITAMYSNNIYPGIPLEDTFLTSELGQMVVSSDLKTAKLLFDVSALLRLGEIDSRIPYALSKMDKISFKLNQSEKGRDEDWKCGSCIRLNNKGALMLQYFKSKQSYYYEVDASEPLDPILPD